MLDPSELSTEYDRTEQEPEAAAEPTEKQRFRISVPTLKTTLTMGEGAKKDELYRLDPNERLHFPGFGVTTEGDLHLETRGPRETSRVKVQTNGEISIHSNQAGVNIGGKQGVAIGTDKVSTMMGATGTYIVGGAFGCMPLGGTLLETGLQAPTRSEHPATPEWTKALDTIKDIVSTMMALNGAYMKMRQNAAEKQKEREDLVDISIKNAAKPAQYASQFASLLQGANKIYKMYQKAVDEKNEDPTLFDLLLASTTIVGQGGVNLISPNTIGLKAGAGISLFSPLAVGIDTDKIASVKSKEGISLLAGNSMEAHATRNMTIVGGVVTQIGSDDLLTISAENDALLKSKGTAMIMAEKELTHYCGGDSATETGTHHFVARKNALFDGKLGAFFQSSYGHVSVLSHKGFVDVAGKEAVAVHSGDALVKLAPGTIALTVDGDPAEADMDPRDYYKPQLEEIKKRWSAAKESKDREETKKLLDDVKKLRSKLASAMADYEGKAGGLAGNFKNGIKVTPSDVVLSVGGDEISLKSGKVEILKSLKIS